MRDFCNSKASVLLQEGSSCKQMFAAAAERSKERASALSSIKRAMKVLRGEVPRKKVESLAMTKSKVKEVGHLPHLIPEGGHFNSDLPMTIGHSNQRDALARLGLGAPVLAAREDVESSEND